MTDRQALYDDGRIACDDEGLVIRWYYLWGAKRIPYKGIRSFATRPLSKVRGSWRLWGSPDFVHWYNLDGNRPNKTVAIDIDTGHRVISTITPDDPDAVTRILAEHAAQD